MPKYLNLITIFFTLAGIILLLDIIGIDWSWGYLPVIYRDGITLLLLIIALIGMIISLYSARKEKTARK